MVEEGILEVSANDLVVFVDETGDERLSDPIHSVFGLGACIVTGGNLVSQVDAPWLQLRQSISGAANTKLHANSLIKQFGSDSAFQVSNYFRQAKIGRVGAGFSKRSSNQTEMGLIALNYTILLNRVVQVARWFHWDRAHVVFEDNQRTNEQVQMALSEFRFQDEGKDIATNFYFMPKSATPGIEVADFIAHGVGGQLRQQLRGHNKPTQSFRSIFRLCDSNLVSFVYVEQAQMEKSETG